MLVFEAISRSQAGYYGLEGATGRWRGSGATRLGLEGTVSRTELHRVLCGEHPRTRSVLPKNLRVGRRDGFDLIFAAPKSVSMLAGLADEGAASVIAAAHDAAVGEAVGFLERNATFVRRGSNGHREPASGLVGVSYQHAESRSGDPHIHTHLVVSNIAEGPDGRWSSLDSRSLYRNGLVAGAIYQAGLRHHMTRLGLPMEWVVHDNGLCDLAGVPRAAIKACSTRSRDIIKEAGPEAGRRRMRAGANRTRRSAGADGEPLHWTERAAGSGFGTRESIALVTQARTDRRHDGPTHNGSTHDGPTHNGLLHDGSTHNGLLHDGPTHTGVRREPVGLGPLERLLSRRSSTFDRGEMIRSLAVTRGGDAAELEQLADTLLDRATLVSPGKWTTDGIAAYDGAVIAKAIALGGRKVGICSQQVLASALSDRPELNSRAAGAVERLVRSGNAVELVASAPLLDQMAVLDAARGAWETGGHVVAPHRSGAQRRRRPLENLIGMSHERSGARPTVLVVEQADRLASRELEQVLDISAQSGAKVVLVASPTSARAPGDGTHDGRLPDNRPPPSSGAYTNLLRTLDPIDVPGQNTERWPTHAQPTTVHPTTVHLPTVHPTTVHLPTVHLPTVRLETSKATVVVARSTSGAIGQMLSDWTQARAAGERTPQAPIMVVPGLGEAAALNDAARAWRGARGDLSGPELTRGRRAYQVGEEVLVLRAMPGVAVGAVGTVSDIDKKGRRMSVEWQGHPEPQVLQGRLLDKIGYGYATTAAYENRLDGPVLSFAASPRIGDREPERRTVHYLSAETQRAERTDTGRIGRMWSEFDGKTSPPSQATSEPLVATVEDPNRGLGDLEADRNAIEERLLTAAPETRRADLQRWAGLGRAVQHRTAALRVAASIAPDDAVTERIGRQPGPGGADRSASAWLDAATTLTAFRERWGCWPGSSSPSADAGYCAAERAAKTVTRRFESRHLERAGGLSR